VSPFASVKRTTRKRLDHSIYQVLLRWCGVAGVLGGGLQVAWGYIENLKVVIHALSFVVPALFLAAVVGLCVLWGSQLGMLGWTGMVLTLYALVWRIVQAIVGNEAAWAYFALGELWPHSLSWLPLICAGLTLVGIATLRSGLSRGAGTWMLATGVFGYIYYLTDSGRILEVRSVHIGFGLLFSLGWVALGVALFGAGTSRPQKLQVPPG
jgi:hypothetical protein